MKWLVLLHVLSSIIGVGPTYFAHVLLRRNQTVGELKQSLRMGGILELFPKIGGSVAVVSGIVLVAWSPNVAFSDLWITSSIVLYVCIQIVAVGLAAPVLKSLKNWLPDTPLSDGEPLPAVQAGLLSKANRLYYAASALGVLLFVMMILKPV